MQPHPIPQPQPQSPQQSHFFATIPPDAVLGQQLTIAAPNGTSVWFRVLPAECMPGSRVQIAHDPASDPGTVQLVPDPAVVHSLRAMGYPTSHAVRAALHEFGTEACVAWIFRELEPQPLRSSWASASSSTLSIPPLEASKMPPAPAAGSPATTAPQPRPPTAPPPPAAPPAPASFIGGFGSFLFSKK